MNERGNLTSDFFVKAKSIIKSERKNRTEEEQSQLVKFQEP